LGALRKLLGWPNLSLPQWDRVVSIVPPHRTLSIAIVTGIRCPNSDRKSALKVLFEHPI